MITTLLVVYVLGAIVWAIGFYGAQLRAHRAAHGADFDRALARHVAIVGMFSATVWPVWIVIEAAIRSVSAAGRWVARIVR